MNTPWASIAKIQVDGSHSGTGFLVAGNYVLTALHVVADKAGRPFPRIRLQFNANAQLANGAPVFETGAHLVQDLWSAEHDFALLQCDNPPPLSEPLLLTDQYDQRAHCDSPGFALQNPLGFTVIGEISSLNDPVESGGTAIGIQFKFGSGVLMKGHSGAPVLVNDRVVGVLRTAFLDEANKTMGGIVHATSMRQVVEFCHKRSPGLLAFRRPIQWPEPSRTQRPLLADRKEEFETFQRMITGQSNQRILLLKGNSGVGKTVLLKELTEYARGIDVLVAWADCKGSPPLDSVFDSLLFDLLPEGLLPRTKADPSARGVFRSSPLIEDLAALDRPLLIAFDTWQDSTGETRKWVEERLLLYFSRMPGAVAIIGGQDVPDHKGKSWEALAEFRDLKPIHSPDDWYEYSQRKWPEKNIAKERVETVILAVPEVSMPIIIHTLLQTLQSRLPTPSAPGASA